jgi:hypothetical protein
MYHDIGTMGLRHEDGIHQRVGQDFGMGLLADRSQKVVAARRCRPCPEYKDAHRGGFPA